jgi:hypothetical protein
MYVHLTFHILFWYLQYPQSFWSFNIITLYLYLMFTELSADTYIPEIVSVSVCVCVHIQWVVDCKSNIWKSYINRRFVEWNAYIDHVVSVWRNEHCWHDYMFIPLVNQKPLGMHSSLVRGCAGNKLLSKGCILIGCWKLGGSSRTRPVTWRFWYGMWRLIISWISITKLYGVTFFCIIAKTPCLTTVETTLVPTSTVAL